MNLLLYILTQPALAVVFVMGLASGLLAVLLVLTIGTEPHTGPHPPRPRADWRPLDAAGWTPLVEKIPGEFLEINGRREPLTALVGVYRRHPRFGWIEIRDAKDPLVGDCWGITLTHDPLMPGTVRARHPMQPEVPHLDLYTPEMSEVHIATDRPLDWLLMLTPELQGRLANLTSRGWLLHDGQLQWVSREPPPPGAIWADLEEIADLLDSGLLKEGRRASPFDWERLLREAPPALQRDLLAFGAEARYLREPTIPWSSWTTPPHPSVVLAREIIRGPRAKPSILPYLAEEHPMETRLQAAVALGGWKDPPPGLEPLLLHGLNAPTAQLLAALKQTGSGATIAALDQHLKDPSWAGPLRQQTLALRAHIAQSLREGGATGGGLSIAMTEGGGLTVAEPEAGALTEAQPPPGASS